MNILHLSGIIAVMLLSAGLLTGCAPLFPEELSQAPEHLIDAYRAFSGAIKALAAAQGKSADEIYKELAEYIVTEVRNRGIEVRECALDPSCDPKGSVLRIWEQHSANKALDALRKSIKKLFDRQKDLTDGQKFMRAAISILEFARRVDPNQEEISRLLKAFGPALVVGVGCLGAIKDEGKLDPRKVHPSFTEFPYEDPLNFFRDLYKLREYADSTMDDPYVLVEDVLKPCTDIRTIRTGGE
jgi:hypothetical protein